MLREPRSLLCQTVDVWCLRGRMPVASQVAVSHVIGEDEDEVRPFARFGRGRRRDDVSTRQHRNPSLTLRVTMLHFFPNRPYYEVVEFDSNDIS